MSNTHAGRAWVQGGWSPACGGFITLLKALAGGEEMHPLDVLRRPLVTEKSTTLQERGKYVFEVVPQANKAQVKEAVEMAFEVRVVSVNMVRIPGEWRRLGLRKVYISGMKKAVVTLRQGDTIKVFEGA